MQIKKVTLAKGLLSIAALNMMTGCVDDKYDLSDLDTTSQFKVNNLIIPVELKTIKLDNIIDIADDDPTIKKDTLNKGTSQEKVIYSIEKGGSIEPTQFSLKEVEVASTYIQPTNIPISVNLPELPNIPGITIPTITVDLPATELRPYEFTMEHIDKALQVLSNVNVDPNNPIDIEVVLNVPTELIGNDIKVAFKNVLLQLPKDLIIDNSNYSKVTGKLLINELPVVDGKATLNIKAYGLDLGDKGKVENQTLSISGEVGVIEGQISIDLKSLSIASGDYNIKAEYHVSGFKVVNFSGKINYDMDDININPISLNDLPDFLDSPETNIIIDDPVILVSLTNPVGEYGLTGSGTLNIKSNFEKESITYSGSFTLSGNESKLAFCAKDKGNSIPAGYTKIEIEGLNRILTSGNNGLPKTIDVSVSNLIFKGNVNKLPLTDLGVAKGDYSFSAPLALGNETKIIYNTTETGWGSDDLDKVNIYLIHLDAECTSNLPVNASIKIFPIDKNGKDIEVEENKELTITANTAGEQIGLNIQGKKVNGKISPIKDFDGIRIEATVTQTSNNPEALGPNLEIMLSKVRVTVSGDYTTDF